MSFTLRQLEYLVAAAEAGQVSSAARELMVSQSSVTAGIQQIERWLGTRLLTRSSRGVILTDAGQAFLPRARQILQLVDAAARPLEQDDRVVGTVRVGVSYTVTGYFLPAHMQRLGALYPNLRIQWLEMARHDAEQALADGQLDLAVLLTSNLRHPALQNETLVHSRRRLWFPPGHPLGDLDRVMLRDVAEHPYVQLTVDEAGNTTQRYWGSSGPRFFMATDSIEGVRSIVANGDGVTILSDMVFRPWSLDGKRIVTRRLEEPVPDMTIGVVWHPQRELSPQATTLLGYFRQPHPGSIG